jgi:hypothetical protein
MAVRKEKTKGRGGAADVQWVTALWADLDVIGEGHKGTSGFESERQAMEFLKSLVFGFSIAIRSGGGLQAHWLLDEPITLEQAEWLLPRWHRYLESHAPKGVVIDNVQDPARMMRAPWGLNHKYDPPRDVSILEAHNRRLGMSELIEELEDEAYAPPTLEPAKPPATDHPDYGDRPGDEFNMLRDGHGILLEHGFKPVRIDRDGTAHYLRPGKERASEGTGAAVYADGHTTVYSETAKELFPGLETGRPYDPFGLFAALKHGGDWQAATEELRKQGLGKPAAGDELLATAQAAQEARGEAPAPVGTPTNGKAPQVDLRASFLERLRGSYYTGYEITRIPARQWLVTDMLYQQSLAVVYGPPGAGKSLLSVDLALSVVTGRDWLGYPTSQGKVLYVVAEGASGTGKRLEAWLTHHGVSQDSISDLQWLTMPANLIEPVETDAFGVLIEEHRPKLVVIDTLARSMVGGEENSAKDMGRVVATLDRLREMSDACVLVVHHTGKDATKGARGSSSLYGAADTMLEVGGMPAHGGVVSSEKQKDCALAPPVWVKYQPAGDSMVPTPSATGPEADGARAAALKVLSEIATPEGVTASVWQEQCEGESIPRTTFYRTRAWLLEHGRVRNVGSEHRPRYVVEASPRPTIFELAGNPD